MAYKVIILYQLYMPSYFLGTFTEYPELALIIIGVFVLILGIILGYAMIHEYRIYLDDHYKARYSFRDFIKRERFYIYLFFASIFIFLTNLLYFLE